MMKSSNHPLPEHSHAISLEKAKSMTAMYRANREIILSAPNQGRDILPLSETFSREAFDHLLATPRCAGIRIYYGMDADLKMHAVIVAVDETNTDLLADSGGQDAMSSSDEPVIIDEGQRCPPICPEKKSPLA